MYEFVSGPLVWVGFLGLFLGSAYKLSRMFKEARREKSVIPTWDARTGMRSVAHWVVPFGARNMRMHPVMTVVSFAFHFCLLLTPLFVMGHAVLWESSWGVSWWSMPAWLADVMTLVVIAGGVFFFLRRLAAPEVRRVSALSDFLLVLLVISPFLTGFLAHQQWLPYRPMLILHIVCGVAWLVAIPFTRLSHMLWFVFSRSYMGSEFGAVRNARDW
jgi:nitrate reductase gamma subunit